MARLTPNPTWTGAISELVVALDLLKREYRIFLPLHHTFGADLVAVKGKQKLLVEVKTAIMSKGGKIQNLLVDHCVDVLAIACKDGTVVYQPDLSTFTLPSEGTLSFASDEHSNSASCPTRRALPTAGQSPPGLPHPVQVS